MYTTRETEYLNPKNQKQTQTTAQKTKPTLKTPTENTQQSTQSQANQPTYTTYKENPKPNRIKEININACYQLIGT